VLIHLPYYYLQIDTVTNVPPASDLESTVFAIYLSLVSWETCDLKQEIALLQAEGFIQSRYLGERTICTNATTVKISIKSRRCKLILK
jgi:ribosomal protein S8